MTIIQRDIVFEARSIELAPAEHLYTTELKLFKYHFVRNSRIR